jgi:hypothetical protein
MRYHSLQPRAPGPNRHVRYPAMISQTRWRLLLRDFCGHVTTYTVAPAHPPHIHQRGVRVGLEVLNVNDPSLFHAARYTIPAGLPIAWRNTKNTKASMKYAGNMGSASKIRPSDRIYLGRSKAGLDQQTQISDGEKSPVARASVGSMCSSWCR